MAHFNVDSLKSYAIAAVASLLDAVSRRYRPERCAFQWAGRLTSPRRPPRTPAARPGSKGKT
ncbi:MAG TPA: hypothetical protein PKC32_10895 [Sphingopyxis sp.]|nr:hypothetical protein [Sphingopyxis sp.]